ncbi:hypothetical protein ACFVAF_04225 [Streptomyces sp. NPDC057596]|uniref:hypothetical protein n=1 Tax=Streptomyces sp. NPDC057596 TaxID=3346178 RepID=UPI00369672A3
MAGKQLTTQNATITTATVEVKTLTISGKQVTLAVFRQLKKAPLIADDGSLNGEPWGIVNYHPDKCGDEDEHWHVVWQRGPELLRATIPVVPDFNRRNYNGNYYPQHTHKSQAANRYLEALVYMGLKAGGDTILPVRGPGYSDYRKWPTYEPGLALPAELAGTTDFPVVAVAGAAAVDAAEHAAHLRYLRQEAEKPLTPDEERRRDEWKEAHRAMYGDDTERTQALLGETLGKLRSRVEEWGGFDAVTDAFTQEIAEVEAYRQKQLAVREELSALPQLFIAV